MYKDKLLVITNNDKVLSKYTDIFHVDFITNEDMLSVFIKTRDYIHNGYNLLTHPLSGSLKPNQTPYKSVLIIKNDNELSFESLSFIENAIEAFKKFNKNVSIAKWSDKIKEDFKTVDLSLIESCIQKNASLFL